MLPSLRRCVVLPLVALIGGLFNVLLAAPASAYGTCSIVAPTRLTVDKPFKRFVGSLGDDCYEAGVDWASWDIRHAYYGPDDMYFFDSGQATATWDFYDWDHLGTYYIEPDSAYTVDSDTLEQNSLVATVRLGSRATLSATRTGKYVTLRTKATRYTPSAEGFRAWRGRAVAFSYRTCATCSWKHLKTRTTGSTGRVQYRFFSPRAKYFRATTSDISTTWGRASGTVRR